MIGLPLSATNWQLTRINDGGPKKTAASWTPVAVSILIGAGVRNRTGTESPPVDFESKIFGTRKHM